jgi:hypothetical protein
MRHFLTKLSRRQQGELVLSIIEGNPLGNKFEIEISRELKISCSIFDDL